MATYVQRSNNRFILLLGTVAALIAALAVLLVATARAAPAGKTPSDGDINEAVESRLFRDPAVPQRDIEISTRQGVVTLSGWVPSLLARDHAQKLAETVRGVRSIVNTLDVRPRTSRTDEQVRRDVSQALLYDAATDAYEVKVSVEKGVAFLRGKVSSFAERELAERVSRGVSGVSDVKNELSVEVKKTRADPEIRAEIEARHRWDAYIDHGLIATTVAEGNVALTGHVGSSAERTRAYVDAWVAGVKSVDVSNLRVEPWAKKSDQRSSKSYNVKDEQIQHAVSTALLHDPRVNSFGLSVSVRDKAVTLRGLVDNLQAQRAAVQDARATVGVTRVLDRIRVKASNVRDDESAKRIRAAFERDPYVERFEILVHVEDGTAYLNGTVDSFYEKHRAEQLAATATGIGSVRNRLVVYDDRLPLVWEPRIFDYNPYDYNWYQMRPYASAMDQEVERNITDELFWSPFVDADQVKVQVTSGVATLQGSVDSHAEMRAAVANAYEGGAVRVTNKLNVLGAK